MKIFKPLRRYDEHVEGRVIPEIIEKAREGQKIGLISDAGTPTLSDPGFKLVRECMSEKIKVVAIPGPSAILTALVCSGLPTDHFMFFGFLPKTEAHIKGVIEKMIKINKVQKTSFVFFESPHRLLKTLSLIGEAAPNCSLAVARELTKLHEEIIRGTASEVFEIFSKRPGTRGEITIVLNLC